jgi:hypothetical protein
MAWWERYVKLDLFAERGGTFYGSIYHFWVSCRSSRTALPSTSEPTMRNRKLTEPLSGCESNKPISGFHFRTRSHMPQVGSVALARTNNTELHFSHPGCCFDHGNVSCTPVMVVSVYMHLQVPRVTRSRLVPQCKFDSSFWMLLHLCLVVSAPCRLLELAMPL